jgi:hypothetical protein
MGPAATVTPIEELQADSTWRAAEGDVEQRFPARIYSQKQIFELALAPEAAAAGLAEVPRLSGQIEEVARKLAVFEVAGHAEILREYQTRKRQERAVATWGESFSSAGDRLRSLADEITPETDPTTFLAADDEGSSSLRPAVKQPSVGLRGSGTLCSGSRPDPTA